MIENLRLSLSDLLGADYTRAVCEARALLTGENPEALRALADEKAFRGAVALPDLLRGTMIPEEPIYLVLELRRQGIATREDSLQLGQIQMFRFFQPQQSFIEGGNAGNIVGPILF